MNVLSLLPHPRAGASGRYRVHQFSTALAERGIVLTVRSFHDDETFARLYQPGNLAAKVLDWGRAYARRRAQIADAGEFEAVLVHREVWPLRGLGLERALVARNPRLVFDLDDAVWLPNVSPVNRAFAFLKDATKAQWLAAHARAVSAGNHDLEAWARQRLGPQGRAFYVPTAVDPDRWKPSSDPSRRRGGDVILGWIGSHTTLGYLELLRPVFDRLAARYPGIGLRVVGGEWRHPGMRVECVPWSERTEVAALEAVDIGLAPLPDDAWARGKCGLKVLQYMALARPVVASAVGAHGDIVRDGETGYLAARDADWDTALHRLIDDPDQRARLGAQGRARVLDAFSVSAVAPTLARALEFAAEGA